MSRFSHRTISASIIYDVIVKKNNISESFQNYLKLLENPQHKSAAKALCYDTLRNYNLLQSGWLQFVKKKPKDKMVAIIMSQALAEFHFLHKAAHIIVNEAINTAKLMNKSWARGLINSCLRQATRNPSIQNMNDSSQYSHPQWWIDMLKADWPDSWKQILSSNNIKPPLWIRKNSHYANTLQSEPHTQIESALKIEACDIKQLHEFNNGEISVQDASAQLAAFILEPQKGEKILDACAAPGGKSCHLLEISPDIRLDSLELYSNRSKKITENLQRLNLNARVLIGNAIQTDDWYEGQAYDKILLDTPCSASGIVRRQPDIKYLRSKQEVDSICLTQEQLLNKLSPLLKPGGILLYATCSVFKQENSLQIKKFLKSHPEFSEIKLKYSFAVNCEYGIQILTGTQDMDGFYYCCLKKHD